MWFFCLFYLFLHYLCKHFLKFIFTIFFPHTMSSFSSFHIFHLLDRNFFPTWFTWYFWLLKKKFVIFFKHTLIFQTFHVCIYFYRRFFFVTLFHSCFIVFFSFSFLFNVNLFAPLIVFYIYTLCITLMIFHVYYDSFISTLISHVVHVMSVKRLLEFTCYSRACWNALSCFFVFFHTLLTFTYQSRVIVNACHFCSIKSCHASHFEGNLKHGALKGDWNTLFLNL